MRAPGQHLLWWWSSGNGFYQPGVTPSSKTMPSALAHQSIAALPFRQCREDIRIVRRGNRGIRTLDIIFPRVEASITATPCLAATHSRLTASCMCFSRIGSTTVASIAPRPRILHQLQMPLMERCDADGSESGPRSRPASAANGTGT